MSKSKEFKVKNVWISVGVSKRFGIGIYFDRLSSGIEFLCFWVSIEY
jgi:hypothetical protein